jgi:hypothetical protein
MFLVLTRTAGAKVTVNMDHVVSIVPTKAGNSALSLAQQVPDKSGLRKPKVIIVRENQNAIAQALAPDRR